MQTDVHEIADGVFRLSTFNETANFTVNQFLIGGEEPLLFHMGHRALFPLVQEAVSRVLPVESLRWLAWSHHEADESGAVASWQDAASNSQVVALPLGLRVNANDLIDRPGREMADGEILDIGAHRLRLIPTPHVPHGWDAQLLWDETTHTLFCSDLFTRIGSFPALSDDDPIEPAMEAEDIFGATSITPQLAPTLRRLAELAPRTLALMHGPAYTGDCAQALHDLADAYAARLTATK